MGPEDRPPVGTLYLDPETGTAYRLRRYSIDWRKRPFTGEENAPDYSTFLPSGAASMARELPESAFVIWTPRGVDA